MQHRKFCCAVTTPEAVGQELLQSVKASCTMRKRFMVWQFFGGVREGALRKLRQIQEYVILKSRQDDAVVALVKFATPFYMGRWVDDGCNTCSTPICNALASVAEGASVVEGLGRA